MVYNRKNDRTPGPAHLGRAAEKGFEIMEKSKVYFTDMRAQPGTNIQDNAVLHTEADRPLTVGDNVTIGHSAVVHCSSVGDNTMVGMGTVLLDGAVIGKNCIIGAGAVVKENAVVPDGTMMVGVPAKPVRELAPEQIAFLERTSPYVALSKEYLV